MVLFRELATLTPASALFKICRAVQLDQASPDFNGKGRREAAPYCSLARRCSSILGEHDLFGKPASILGSSPRTGFFRIML
jgi:hypothetical protein